MSIQTRWSGYSAQDPQNRPAVPEGAGRRRSARFAKPCDWRFSPARPAVSPRSRGRSRQSLPAGRHSYVGSAQRPAPGTAAGRRRISRSRRAPLFPRADAHPSPRRSLSGSRTEDISSQAAGGPALPLFRPVPPRETPLSRLCWANRSR